MIRHITAQAFHPLRDNVFVEDLEHGVTITRHGILLPDDDMTDRGIHPRWGRVWAIGPEVEDIAVGEWLLIEHGRWTLGIDLQLPQGMVRVWRIEWPSAVLLASDTDPRERIGIALPNRH